MDPIWLTKASDHLGVQTPPNYCARFVGKILQLSGLPATGSIKARSYLDYGIPLSRPRRGCLVIFWRRAPETDLGHIGFYVSRINSHLIILSNHHGRVSVQAFSNKRLLGYRWPSDYQARIG
jgi:uncharacterized protein (TIGR02594 family)